MGAPRRQARHTHGNLKAVAGLAQEVLLGDAAVLENQVAGARRPNAELYLQEGPKKKRG